MTLLLLVSLARAQDTTAPINAAISAAGGAAWTNSSTVSLALSADDDTAVTQMCLSNATTCTAWLSYATSSSWNIGTTQGTRTVYAKFRDAAGNTSSQVSDTIGYDSVAPTGGSLSSAIGGSGELLVSWAGITDATSGISSYKLVYSTSTTPTSKCTAGTTAYTGSDTTTTLTGLSDGTTYYLRLCAIDAAGNTATGVTATGVPKAESNAPSGTVVINSGATYATSTSATLSLAATDDTGVTQMCISNTSTCTAYQTYTTTKTWTLSGSGTKTVYVYFRDASGNVSAAATDSIVVDSTRPTNGTLTATGADQAVALSWSGFSDAGSGLASYKVVQGTSGAPSSCSTGTLVYSGADTSATITGLSNGTKYYYRICALDNAGNTSSGVTASATAASELDAPTNATITINSGAAWTNTTAVTLALAADDASGVAEVCVSNSTTCTTWTPYTATRSWTLGGSGTTRTVYAWFEDTNGNRTSSPVSDTISIDSVKPTNGAVTGTPGTVWVDVAWSGFADTTSGVASYKVVYTKASVAPANCSIGNVGYTGTGTSASITGLSDGAYYSFRVCAIDAAGNTSTGTTLTVRTIDDVTPPTGTLVINDGALWTNNPNVALGLAATDDLSGVGRVCLSESADVDDCGHWESYAATSDWSFSAVEGTRTLYAWYEDGAFNLATTAATDSIGLDLTDPVDGTVAGTYSAGTGALSWSGYSDALSGVASYVVAYNLDGSEPTDCSSADIIESLTDTTLTVTGLPPIPFGFRVCATDLAGNVSAGTTITISGCIASAETCNGADDDCDGVIDDEPIDAAPWFYDGDGDGFGDPAITTGACSQPSGYVATADDCDDADASVSPGAAEVCDGVDEDCDGLIDDDALDATDWYPDADSDGYGDDANAVVQCSAPAGYLALGGDCDDTNADIAPDMDETCNGVDDDCDGLTDPPYFDGDLNSALSGWQLNGAAAQTWSGSDGSLQLTSSTWSAGSAWFTTPVVPQDLYISFSFTFSGGSSGADGMAFAFSEAGSTTLLGGVGYLLGLYNSAGYNVEFDSFYNSGTDPVVPHVGFNRSTSPISLAYTSDFPARNTEHLAEIWFDQGEVAVYVDGDYLLSYTVSGYSASEVRLGFTAGTGGLADQHIVDDVYLGCGSCDQVWYADADGDGYGDPATGVTACAPPSGYITDGTDCDDTSAALRPDVPWYADADGDGYGDSSSVIYACAAPTGYVASDDDCDDADLGVSPAGAEACDTVDNDCDGSIDEAGCSCSAASNGDSLYLFCTETVDWSTAQARCDSYGYHLLTIDDAAENTWVDGQIDARSNYSSYHTFSWWMGYNDRAVSGTFSWEDGSTSTYTNWRPSGPSEPNNCYDLYDPGNCQEEACGQLNWHPYGWWNDFLCTETLYYVCEAG